MIDPRLEQGLTAPERRDLHRLWRALRAGNPRPTRRDLLRWSATAGAVATANQGIVSAAPRRAPRSLRQDAPVVEGAEITVPLTPWTVDFLDPHRSADYGGFWVMYPNVWGGFLRYDELGRIALDLADQVVRSQDGLRYTLTIREGRPTPAATRSSPNISSHPGTGRSIRPISRRWSPSWSLFAASTPGSRARRAPSSASAPRRSDRRHRAGRAGHVLPVVPGLVRLVGRRSRNTRSLGGRELRPQRGRYGTMAVRGVRAGYAVRDGAKPQLL